MSLIALHHATRQKVGDHTAKLVLILLADRHNEDTGECFPSVNRICEDAEVSRATALAKLEKLVRLGLITIEERRREDGTRMSSNYHLLFVPARDPEPREAPKAGLPPDDWQPRPATIEKIREEFPHHDTSDDFLAFTVREWIDFCHGSGRRYADFDRAWANSARRQLRRRTSGPASLDARRSKRGGAGALSGAMRRAMGE